MSAITRELIRELSAIDTDGLPVTTCYLNVDGRERVRPVDYVRDFERLARRLRSSGSVPASVVTDIDRLSTFLGNGFDRSSVRGIAIFCSSAADLWRVVHLPVPVHSRLVQGTTPALSQLESVVQELRSIGLVLVDRQRTRLLVFEGGQLVEHDEMLDELPRDYDERGHADLGDTTSHVEELAHQHLRDAAAAAFKAFQARNVGRVAIGGPAEATSELESFLHPYLRERLIGRVKLPLTASLEEIRHKMLDLQAQAERAEEAAAVTRLRNAVGAGNRGVAGLAPTLAALSERRVEQLLVSEGFEETGWRCPRCAVLAAVGPKCPACESQMDHLDDVVEEAVQEAMNQSCHVEMCVENADLDVHGRIGALLRY